MLGLGLELGLGLRLGLWFGVGVRAWPRGFIYRLPIGSVKTSHYTTSDDNGFNGLFHN